MQFTTAYPMMRGSLTDKSFPEIIQLTQYIRQSFHALQPSRRNTFFENISDYFYNLVSVKQQKIDDKEWKPFDTAFSELIQDDIQAKQNSALNWLTRVYEIESLA